MMKDYYAILGVSSDATQKEIKQAYAYRVRIVHPDRFEMGTLDWENANKMLVDLNEAYAQLRDPKNRTTYDSAFTRTRANKHKGETKCEDTAPTQSPPQTTPPPPPQPEEPYKGYGYSHNTDDTATKERASFLKVILSVCCSALFLFAAVNFYHTTRASLRNLALSSPSFQHTQTQKNVEKQKTTQNEKISLSLPPNNASQTELPPRDLKPDDIIMVYGKEIFDTRVDEGEVEHTYIRLLLWDAPQMVSAYMESDSISFYNDGDVVLFWTKLDCTKDGIEALIDSSSAVLENGSSLKKYFDLNTRSMVSLNLIDLQSGRFSVIAVLLYDSSGNLLYSKNAERALIKWYDCSKLPEDAPGKLLMGWFSAYISEGYDMQFANGTHADITKSAALFIEKKQREYMAENILANDNLEEYDIKMSGVISTGMANCRSLPSTASEILDKISQGTPVFITQKLTRADGAVWYLIEHADGEGWISGKLLKVY